MIVSLGVGVLFGIAVFELLPGAWEAGWVGLLGVVLLFLVFIGIRWSASRDDLVGLVLVGFFIHAAMDGGFAATTFAAGTTTGLATVAGLILHELPEFAAVAAVFTGFGRSLRRVGVYQVIAVVIVAVSFGLVYFVLGQLSTTVLAFGLGAAGGAFTVVGLWDAVEIVTERQWSRGVALGIGVTLVVGLKILGML